MYNPRCMTFMRYNLGKNQGQNEFEKYTLLCNYFKDGVCFKDCIRYIVFKSQLYCFNDDKRSIDSIGICFKLNKVEY